MSDTISQNIIKVNRFFESLRQIFGESRFRYAYKLNRNIGTNDNPKWVSIAEDEHKNIYGPFICKLSDQEIINGMYKLTDQRTKGKYGWLDIGEVLTLFQKGSFSQAQFLLDYREWCDGGVAEMVEVTLPYGEGTSKISTGKKEWSSGYIAEIARRLYSPQYHKQPMDAFRAAYKIIMTEMDDGVIYEIPKKIVQQNRPDSIAKPNVDTKAIISNLKKQLGVQGK